MSEFHIAPFSVDVTCPIGHRCMAIIPTLAKEIVDPLYAKGFVLLGGAKPVVQVAVDWCELRNEAYDRWRSEIARAAGTTPEHVLLSCLHQHDAPVADLGAGNLLDSVGLTDEMFSYGFHEECVQRVAEAVRRAIAEPLRVTHVGHAQARVEQVASNRRVEWPDGRVTFGRGSASGGNEFLKNAPEGLIDPFLKTLSFWDGETPRLAVHFYATHPMSYYGRGGVSADFVGMARDLHQRQHPKVPQIYVTGCGGDVTAGKFNDGSPANRPLLAQRLLEAMKSAWEATERKELKSVELRNIPLDLPYRSDEAHSTAALRRVLEDDQAAVRDRILAAMGMNSQRRVREGNRIDFSCLHLGDVRFVLLPAETFVGYQLLAQEKAAEKFVVCAGYGECWPGYVPTAAGFADGFEDTWLWVEAGCEERISAAMDAVM